ncbi:MAG TPA: sigma 54-interacting transcriptional regulator [Gemmatimonadales bacterium]|nr:sigma 54-interacting transcriptional regulator [Gemmatimonadales bacterium]
MRLLILGNDRSGQSGPALEAAGYEVLLRSDFEAGLIEAQAGAVEGILLDLEAGEAEVLDFLRRYRAGGGSGIILVTGDMVSATLAPVVLREGADGFVRQPVVPEELVLALHQAFERERLRQEVARLRVTLGARGLEPLVVAEDPKMRGLLEQAARAAAGDGAVLITGERGTGKALLAQAMHRFSRRGEGAFVTVDCGAAPDLGDPQLLWRSADRGTLLFEDVVALSPQSQCLLLSKLGPSGNGDGNGNGHTTADVRVMATASTPIERAVEEGRFRPELFERLNGALISLPPLRERPEDIPALVTHFAQQVASRTGRPISITPQALALLSGFSWPGNVRELKQVVERAATLSPTGRLDRSDFPSLTSEISAGASGNLALKPQVEAVEREAILRALASAKGNRREGARLLQVSLRTLFYKIRRYGIA